MIEIGVPLTASSVASRPELNGGRLADARKLTLRLRNDTYAGAVAGAARNPGPLRNQYCGVYLLRFCAVTT